MFDAAVADRANSWEGPSCRRVCAAYSSLAWGCLGVCAPPREERVKALGVTRCAKSASSRPACDVKRSRSRSRKLGGRPAASCVAYRARAPTEHWRAKQVTWQVGPGRTACLNARSVRLGGGAHLQIQNEKRVSKTSDNSKSRAAVGLRPTCARDFRCRYVFLGNRRGLPEVSRIRNSWHW